MISEQHIERLKNLGLTLRFFRNNYGPDAILLKTSDGEYYYAQKEPFLRKLNIAEKKHKLNLAYLLTGASYTKDSLNFADYWYVTECGVLLSKRSPIVLRQIKSKTGYWTVATKLGGRLGKDICVKVHREVAFSFIENPQGYVQVNHIDGNKLNNHRSNLEWCNNQFNTIHARDNGLLGMSLTKGRFLSLEIVNLIREWGFYKTAARIKRDLEINHGIIVIRSGITDIINRRSYRFYFDTETIKTFHYHTVDEFNHFKKYRIKDDSWIKHITHYEDGSVDVTLDLSKKLYMDLQDVDVPVNNDLMKGFKKFIVYKLEDFEKMAKGVFDYTIVSMKKMTNNALVITAKIT